MESKGLNCTTDSKQHSLFLQSLDGIVKLFLLSLQHLVEFLLFLQAGLHVLHHRFQFSLPLCQKIADFLCLLCLELLLTELIFQTLVLKEDLGKEEEKRKMEGRDEEGESISHT